MNIKIPLLVTVAALLSGCGAEAPPCNSADATRDVQALLMKFYDESLADLRVKAKDVIQSIELEQPLPTAYDEAIKRRSCKATAIVSFEQAKIDQLEGWISAAKAQSAVANALAGVLGGPPSSIEKRDLDILKYAIASQGQARTQYRVPAVYKIQQVEGSKDFAVEVNAQGPVEAMRVVALSQRQLAEGISAESGKKQPAPAIPGKTQVGGFPMHSITTDDAMVVPVHSKHCGSEALCVLTRDGMFHLNAAALDQEGLGLIETAVSLKTPLCMKGVSPIDGQADHYTADDVVSKC